MHFSSRIAAIKKPASRKVAGFFIYPVRLLHVLCFVWHNDRGMIAFRPLLQFEVDCLTCFQRLVAFHLYRGVVGENIFATSFRTDKPKSFALLNHLTVPVAIHLHPFIDYLEVVE